MSRTVFDNIPLPVALLLLCNAGARVCVCVHVCGIACVTQSVEKWRLYI